MLVVEQIGWRALAALARTGGTARVIARMTGSTWLDADGDVLWLGRAPLHPRAILVAGDVVTGAEIVSLDVGDIRAWRPTPPAITAGTEPALRGAARELRAELSRVGTVDGLAHLVTRVDARAPDGVLADVLRRAAPHVAALDVACSSDRPDDAIAPAVALLGLGAGLTPSGDDLVGGVFFGRRLLAGANGDGWRMAADVVRHRARERTHAISQALLGDLLDGEGHAALHDLVGALVGGDDLHAAARALTRIGHTSGWDILAGLLVALAPR